MSETNDTYMEQIGALPSGGHHLFSYVSGLVLSLVLTGMAYLIATHTISLEISAVASLLVLAVLQFFAQMYFFLHLGIGSASAHKSAIFAYAVFIVLIIVVGSIWIMNSLNARMMAHPDTMTPETMEAYMHRQTGI